MRTSMTREDKVMKTILSVIERFLAYIFPKAYLFHRAFAGVILKHYQPVNS